MLSLPSVSSFRTVQLSENVQSVRKRTLFFALTLVFNDLCLAMDLASIRAKNRRLSVYATGRQQRKTVNKDRKIWMRFRKKFVNKERNKKIIRYGGMGAAGIVVISVLISLMRTG